MSAIRFETTIDDEQIIRPPVGTSLPQGAVEVVVRRLVNDTAQPSDEGGDPLAATRNWLLELATVAEQLNPDLPDDLATHHDYYAHSKPIHE